MRAIMGLTTEKALDDCFVSAFLFGGLL